MKKLRFGFSSNECDRLVNRFVKELKGDGYDAKPKMLKSMEDLQALHVVARERLLKLNEVGEAP